MAHVSFVRLPVMVTSSADAKIKPIYAKFMQNVTIAVSTVVNLRARQTRQDLT